MAHLLQISLAALSDFMIEGVRSSCLKVHDKNYFQRPAESPKKKIQIDIAKEETV